MKLVKEKLRELVYQKGKFDLNRKCFGKHQKKEFDDSKFKEMGGFSIKNV